MEITINIKLEDEDIGELIKSIWELFKKSSKNIPDIKIEPYNPPPIVVPSNPAPIGDPLCGCVVGDSNIPCGCVVGDNPNCPCQCVVGDSADCSCHPVKSYTHVCKTDETVGKLGTVVYDTLKEAVCDVDDVYFSNNGESVKKLDNEKKNEEI